MKESRRHRWVLAMAATGSVDQGVPALCRDCGLETSLDKVKHGGFGDCLGKMVERQHGLALISGDPQALGNMSIDRFVMACVGCGEGRWLHMIAHRNQKGEITGYVFACAECCEALADCQVEIMPREKGESDGSDDHGRGNDSEHSGGGGAVAADRQGAEAPGDDGQGDTPGGRLRDSDGPVDTEESP